MKQTQGMRGFPMRALFIAIATVVFFGAVALYSSDAMKAIQGPSALWPAAFVEPTTTSTSTIAPTVTPTPTITPTPTVTPTPTITPTPTYKDFFQFSSDFAYRSCPEIDPLTVMDIEVPEGSRVLLFDVGPSVYQVNCTFIIIFPEVGGNGLAIYEEDGLRYVVNVYFKPDLAKFLMQYKEKKLGSQQ